MPGSRSGTASNRVGDRGTVPAHSPTRPPNRVFYGWPGGEWAGAASTPVDQTPAAADQPFGPCGLSIPGAMKPIGWMAAASCFSLAAICSYSCSISGVTDARDSWSAARSEEHTSELQSLMRISYAVFCLKKKKHIKIL